MAIFLILGIPTALVPNSTYIRMTPASPLDYFFLVATSAMLGAYLALQFYGKVPSRAKEDLSAVSGGVAGVLAFGCPICNALLVSLFGTAALLTYYDPARPLVGVIGIALLGGAVYLKLRNIKCSSCSVKKV